MNSFGYAELNKKEVCEFMLCAFHFTQFSHDTLDAITRYVPSYISGVQKEDAKGT